MSPAPEFILGSLTEVPQGAWRGTESSVIITGSQQPLSLFVTTP